MDIAREVGHIGGHQNRHRQLGVSGFHNVLTVQGSSFEEAPLWALECGYQVLATPIGTLRQGLPSRLGGSVSIYCTVFLQEVPVLTCKNLSCRAIPTKETDLPDSRLSRFNKEPNMHATSFIQDLAIIMLAAGLVTVHGAARCSCHCRS
ncbi:hypothetical protein [Pseudomonas sp. R1-7]|uniref:hypothetical protein n=1 Tax=Pseudomonas sp. R1-7 TaxID=2817398 RepID=UPI003DA90C91